MRLYGRNPVIERLKSNPKTIQKIYLQEGQGDSSYIREKAKKWGISTIIIPRHQAFKAAGNVNTQGVLAEIDDFAYTPFDDLLAEALEKKLTILFLDNLNDPQNLGVIIRSAACLGGFAIVLPIHDSVEVTEAVLRVASGGENYIPIAKVANLNQTILRAKKEGFWIAGTTLEGGKNLMETEILFPLALVIGSEQKGVREIIQKNLDFQLTLPMPHARLSFNVAQATTIFCYEITKQKNQKK